MNRDTVVQDWRGNLLCVEQKSEEYEFPVFFTGASYDGQWSVRLKREDIRRLVSNPIVFNDYDILMSAKRHASTVKK
jgi:hypothetical protein